MKKLVTVLFFVLIWTVSVSGSENTSLLDQFDILEFDSFNQQAYRLQEENAYLKNFDLKDVAIKIALGEFDWSLSGIAKGFFQLLFKESVAQFVLMQKILLVCILSALLKNLTFSFGGQSVSEMGFYACYLVLVILLLDSLKLSTSLVYNTTGELISIMQATLPLMTAFFAVSGQVASIMTISPVLVAGIQLMALLVKNIILPLIGIAAILEIVNYISEKNVLDQLASLFKSSIGWLLKGTALLFMTILSLQSLGAPILNSVLNKTAKAAVGAVPVVGDVLTGAVDTVMGFTTVVKSGTAAGVILFVVLYAALPVIKLIAVIFAYKIMAAFVQPVCEDRIVDCIDSIGSYAALLLGALVTIVIMFIFMMLIVLAASRFA